MRLLLDTHAFLWWLDGDRKLPARARRLIGSDENEVLVSAASAWEIATKVRIGKLPGAVDVASDLASCIRSQRFTPLSVEVVHAQTAGLLTWAHRDPFDRMLAAQCLVEGLPLVSMDEAFDQTSVRRLW